MNEEIKKYLEEVKLRESKATKGPWVDRRSFSLLWDRHFVSKARTDIPKLMAIIEAQELRVESLLTIAKSLVHSLNTGGINYLVVKQSIENFLLLTEKKSF